MGVVYSFLARCMLSIISSAKSLNHMSNCCMLIVSFNNFMSPLPAPVISVMVYLSLTIPLMLGRTGTTLTCDVSGADNLQPLINYQWTKDNEPVQDGSSRILNLSPLRLYHAGNYACNVIVNSTLIKETIAVASLNSQSVIIQSELVIFTA